MDEQKTTLQNVLSIISNMMQFVLGFILGVALIGGSAVGAAYYYFKKVSSSVPTKPVYPEDTAKKEDSDTTPKPESAETTIKPETKSANIPPNAYYATVTWPQGLSLRAEPSLSAIRIGGIGYDTKILILQDSSDKKWQKVRIPETGKEGWVKANNVKRVAN